MRNLKFAFRWAAVMCSTGPSALTASAREVVIQNPLVPYRLVPQDFRSYGGKFKAVRVKVSDNPNHYMNMHKKKNMNLLSSYMAERPVTAADLHAWEGEAVQGQNGKEIFVINHGKKRGIPNFDTFLALNFTLADVRVVSDAKVDMIELGPSMPNLSVRRGLRSLSFNCAGIR